MQRNQNLVGEADKDGQKEGVHVPVVIQNHSLRTKCCQPVGQRCQSRNRHRKIVAIRLDEIVPGYRCGIYVVFAEWPYKSLQNSIAADKLIENGVVTFGRAIMYTIMNVYAVRMAGVFMISLDTIWLQTRVVPRPFVFVTYALALLLLVAISFSLWMILIFPAWVFVISVYILRVSMRGKEAEVDGFVGSHDASTNAR